MSGGATGGSYENRSYSTMAYPGSHSRTDTLEENVLTTKAEVFIKEDGIDLKQPNFTREEVQDWVGRILDWVHGPGTKLLDSQRELPTNFDEAERIRKNHEQFEFKCMIFLESERIKQILSSQQILVIVNEYLADIKLRLGKQLEQMKLRILETRKYLQLLVYDRDSKQTVTWLDDITRIVIETYLKYNIGKTPMETQQLLQQYQTLKTKSKETFEYGMELIAALAKMLADQGKPTQACVEMRGSLDVNWRRLTDILGEIGDRYTAADAFYENVDLNLERIERLILLICRDLDTGITLEDVRKTYATERNEIVRAYESTKKIGVGLMERVRHAVANIPETVNQPMIDEVIDVIKVKLFTLWLKIRELYYYLGQAIEVTEITERWQVIRISIDKFFERMLFWEARWKEGELPFTIPEAEYLINEHQKAKEEIRNLFQDVDMDLQKIVRDGDSVEVARMAEKAGLDAKDKKDEWMKRWERHMEILDMRYRLLLRLRDLDLEVDGMVDRLGQLENRTVEETKIVTETVAEAGRLAAIEIRAKMQSLFKETRDQVRQDFERHIEPIEAKWQKFVKELELFQMFVDTILRMLQFIEKLYAFIEELNTQLPLCRGREEAEPWFQKILGYNKTTASFDCDWLLNVATRLFGNDEKPQPVIEKLRFIAAKLKMFETSIMEMVTVETITVVHSVRKERKFFRELADLTLTEGSPCSLEVEYAIPSGTADVEWQRNGRPLPTNKIGGKWILDDQDGFTSVACDGITVDDAGTFACVIRDPTGVMETNCRLRVLCPPAFTMELQPARVNQDEPLLLQCKVKGSPNPDIQWFKDGQVLRRNFEYDIENLDGVCALKVTRVDGSHAGVYSCRAVNQAGEANTSASVEVKEFIRCQFLRTLPPEEHRQEGERLQLHVEFEGDPTPEVTWFRDDLRLAASPPRISIRTGGGSSTCTIDPLEPRDEGLYSVQIRNPAGVQKTVCNIGVRPLGEAPTFLSPLMDETVAEGSQLRLTCRISGQPAPEVAWYFNNRPLGRYSRRGMRLHSDPDTGVHSLEIDSAGPDDEGEYRVVAENRDGRVETKCRVVVEPPSEDDTPAPFAPRFAGDISEELVAHVSDKVTLQCTVYGQPLPTVTWHKDGVRLYTDDHVIIVASNDMGSADCRCTLRVIEDEFVDKRTTLVFQNTVVKAPPEFVRLFRDEFCKVGDDVILECEIDGIPDPAVWWSFNGQPIGDRDYRFRTSSNERVHSLYIQRVSTEETGRYSVTAENSSGVATCSALLIVEETGKTGSYENAARLSSQATNSWAMTHESGQQFVVPSHSQMSQMAGGQTTDSVDVTPSFDLTETRSIEYGAAAPAVIEEPSVDRPMSQDRGASGGTVSAVFSQPTAIQQQPQQQQQQPQQREFVDFDVQRRQVREDQWQERREFSVSSSAATST
uniref:Ig-like domain-containing protein n=1 Tax=Macrostomum lignano TaxID=282301 RepID=A0A1I8IN78_9PLAT